MADEELNSVPGGAPSPTSEELLEYQPASEQGFSSHATMLEESSYEQRTMTQETIVERHTHTVEHTRTVEYCTPSPEALLCFSDREAILHTPSPQPEQYPPRTHTPVSVSWPPKYTPPPTGRGPQKIDPKAIEITLSKDEGQSWGFRLGGGKEFSAPLTVVRVQLGGLAEQQGFQVGDIVDQINGMPTSEMTHGEALEIIKKAGNKCLYSITRTLATTGKVLRPIKPMAPLEDFTTVLPAMNGARPAVASPIAAAAAMRNVALGQLSSDQAETHFTEEVIAETMTSHAEIVAGNALGVNFHKFEPRYDHLALSGVYQMLLEEETRRGRPMSLPGPRKPEIVPKKSIAKQAPPKEPTPPPPPKTPTPPPKEPSPVPVTPTPPPQEPSPTPPPKSPTPQPKTPTPAPTPEPTMEEPELIPGSEHEFLLSKEAAGKIDENAQHMTNGLNGNASEEQGTRCYYQRQHQELQERLSREQQTMLQQKIQQKMHLEECRRRINKAQKTIYAPTVQKETVQTDCVTGIERKLPKAGSRYRPALPLTAAASLQCAFSNEATAFDPFKAPAPPVFQPSGAPKPLAKPACAVQCVIPMKWHPPNQLINGQPYKYQPTTHIPSAANALEQEFLPPPLPPHPKPQFPAAQPPATAAQEERKKPPGETHKPAAHPVHPVPDVPKLSAFIGCICLLGRTIVPAGTQVFVYSFQKTRCPDRAHGSDSSKLFVYLEPILGTEDGGASPNPQFTEDDIAEMMSSNAEVIVGQTLGVNFQKYMPGFDHLKHSAVYRMVHGLED